MQLRSILAPELDPLFWPMSRLGVDSAWVGHVPFAHWLVVAHRPKMLVELGTHVGVSYSAFCEAVQRAKIDCSCLAFDTWAGDDHSGRYGGEVYAEFMRFHNARYSAFSHPTRCTFDDGVAYIPDASVDLLHIDGLHTFDAVEHDFQTWKPKLSERAIVLFHDINARERDFGVWRLWEQLQAIYPSFTFLHGHGLGVLAVGPSQTAEVRMLTTLPPDLVQLVRERFSFLGDRWEGCAEQDRLLRRIEELTQARTMEASDRDGLLRHIDHLDKLRVAETADRDRLAQQLDTLRAAELAEREGRAYRAGQEEALRAEDAMRRESAAATLHSELAAARAAVEQAASVAVSQQEQLDAARLGERAAQLRVGHLEALLQDTLHDVVESGPASGA